MECEYPPLLMRTAGSQLSVLGAGSLRPIMFYRRLSGSVFFFPLFQEGHEGYFYPVSYTHLGRGHRDEHEKRC